MPVLSTPGAPYTPGRTNFGLLPEPERSPASFFTSLVINGLIVLIAIYLGSQVKQLVQHKYEETVLILPTTPPPPPKIKLEPPKITPPEPPKVEVKLETPKINMPKPEPKPKPIEMEAKVNLPVIKAAKPAVVLAPQPKAALTAAMPAQNNLVKASTAQVHLGETFGVTPNPNATRPATVAAIGNPYGGLQGPAVAPHGVVGSTGIGNGVKSGSNAGMVGKVASAGLPGGTGSAGIGVTGKVGSTGLANAVVASAPVRQMTAAPAMTSIEVLSKPPVQYTNEARQLRIEGDVVLRVTFTAAGQVIVQGITRGLGHGLDEEARRVAQQIRFRPATKNGQAVDSTTTIRITFQLA